MKKPKTEIKMDIVRWLQEWYMSECNDDWEHSFGIRIETTDNPGWSVSIDLEETRLEGFTVDYRLVEKSETDWYGYSIKDNVFNGVGDPNKLELLLEIFKNIIDNPIKELPT